MFFLYYKTQHLRGIFPLYHKRYYRSFKETIKMEMGGKKEVDARLQSPFTALIAGPTGCGKTETIFQLIENASQVANPPPYEIIYCYGAYQKRFDSVKGVRFVEGMIDVLEEVPRDGKNRWLIIDDLMDEEGGKTSSNALYTKHSHHMNISVFFIVQNLFHKAIRTVSINSHYMFLFKNPRAMSSVQHLGSQLFPNTGGFFVEAFRDATEKPFSYLFVDMKQETDERMRVRAGFFSPAPIIAYASRRRI